MAGWTEMPSLVTLKRDFRFTPTQMPADTHDQNFRVSPLQIHYEGHHNQDNGKSPFSYRLEKSHIAFQNDLPRRSGAQMS